MASSNGGRGGGGGGEDLQQLAELSKTLKEGERLLGPTRRPDGSLRKPIRIRAGYVPQDEVAIYQSKGALWKKEMAAAQELPPGYDPVLDLKPKTKSVKRNERKKEKRLQAAIDKVKELEPMGAENLGKEEVLSAKNASQGSESIKSVASHMDELTISANHSTVTPLSGLAESLDSGCSGPDIDKKIRALKKKIRLAEAQKQKTQQQDMNPEQLDKMRKLDDWQKELKLLEDKKAKSEAS